MHIRLPKWHLSMRWFWRQSKAATPAGHNSQNSHNLHSHFLLFPSYLWKTCLKFHYHHRSSFHRLRGWPRRCRRCITRGHSPQHGLQLVHEVKWTAGLQFFVDWWRLGLAEFGRWIHCISCGVEKWLIRGEHFSLRGWGIEPFRQSILDDSLLFLEVT